MRFRLPLLLTLLGPLLAGWTQYTTQEAHHCGLRWYGGPGRTETATIKVDIDQGGVDGVSATGLLEITKAALAQWQTVTCPDEAAKGTPLPLKLQIGGLAKPTPVGAICSDPPGAEVGCHAKASNGNFVSVVRAGELWPYGNSVFALTVLTFNTCTGEIVDGDILLDDGHHDFCAETCKPDQQSLCNTLTHEAGHLLGLDHSQAEQATMYASASPGETAKCTLHGDDRQGICDAYATGCKRGYDCAKEPVSSPGGTSTDNAGSSAPDTAGCQAERVEKITGFAAIVVLMVAVVATRRRSRPCTSKSSTAPT